MSAGSGTHQPSKDPNRLSSNPTLGYSHPSHWHPLYQKKNRLAGSEKPSSGESGDKGEDSEGKDDSEKKTEGMPRWMKELIRSFRSDEEKKKKPPGE